MMLQINLVAMGPLVAEIPTPSLYQVFSFRFRFNRANSSGKGSSVVLNSFDVKPSETVPSNYDTEMSLTRL